jgi:hypothetical protein
VVALPLAPIRRARIQSLVIAAIAGISLVIGSCSVGTPSWLSLVLGNAHNPLGSLEIFVLLNANPAGVQGAGGYRATTRATLNHPVWPRTIDASRRTTWSSDSPTWHRSTLRRLSSEVTVRR